MFSLFKKKPVVVEFFRYNETKKNSEDIPVTIASYTEAQLPIKKHYGDSGYDIRACFDDKCIEDWQIVNGTSSLPSITIEPGETKIIPTGLCCQIPDGYELQCRPRSGASKDSIVAILGTIDSAYTGHIRVIICNTSNDKTITITHQDRIAQLVIAPILNSSFVWGKGLKPVDKNRGNGFGSSGKN